MCSYVLAACLVPATASGVPARGDNHRRLAPELSFHVWSASMRRQIPVNMIPAAGGGPAPTLYLLNGANGGRRGSSWFEQTDIRRFFAGEHVNVVVPMGGAASYFADWQHPDPVLGTLKWATFLTKELPAVIDKRFNGNGHNAIVGISMAGTSVFQLSLREPTLYSALGSFSGCAQTSDPAGRLAVGLVVKTRGGGNASNMWGPANDPAWRDNDPYLHVGAFRGKSIYVSNGSGTPGKYDTLHGPGINGDRNKLVTQIAVGALIETATNHCAHNLQRQMAAHGVRATFHFYSGGTHAWPYWQDELHRAWPQFKKALNP
ncbi:MAG: alpha/beta hydrolase family protein [Gordonia sp. (in: high G+C Gram-positive bacteria)]